MAVCVARRKEILRVLQPLYIHEGHKMWTFAMYVAMTVSYVGVSILFVTKILSQRSHSLGYNIIYPIQQFGTYIVAAALAAVFSECLDTLTLEFSELRSEINRLGLVGSKNTDIFITKVVIASYGFKARYIRLVGIGKKLDHAFYIPVVLFVVVIFAQVLTKMFYAINKLSPTISVCLLLQSALLVAKIALFLGSCERAKDTVSFFQYSEINSLNFGPPSYHSSRKGALNRKEPRSKKPHPPEYPYVLWRIGQENP